MSAKIFTTVKGLALAIGEYGVATNDEPAIVPDEVATQIEEEIRGERTNPKFGEPVADGEEPQPRFLKIGRGPDPRFRVVRDEQPKAAKASTAAPTRRDQPKPAEAQKPAGEEKSNT